jgi:Mg2+ and Co2+ transporter CorA
VKHFRIRHDNSGKSVQPGWMDPDRDFVHIVAEPLALRTTAEGLISTFRSLASIVGNRDLLKEARSVQALTKLGMIFLPLSLVAGLFRMSGAYEPGGQHFWTYFAVSIPCVLLTFGGAWLWSDGWQKLGLIIAAIRIKRHASEHRDLTQA